MPYTLTLDESKTTLKIDLINHTLLDIEQLSSDVFDMLNRNDIAQLGVIVVPSNMTGYIYHVGTLRRTATPNLRHPKFTAVAVLYPTVDAGMNLVLSMLARLTGMRFRIVSDISLAYDYLDRFRTVATPLQGKNSLN